MCWKFPCHNKLLQNSSLYLRKEFEKINTSKIKKKVLLSICCFSLISHLVSNFCICNIESFPSKFLEIKNKIKNRDLKNHSEICFIKLQLKNSYYSLLKRKKKNYENFHRISNKVRNKCISITIIRMLWKHFSQSDELPFSQSKPNSDFIFQ